jgi:hypothetical protein
VAVGSRGISDLAAIVSETVYCLREMSLDPFILPAMGSHGGATDEGQRRMLDDLGVSEKTVGARTLIALDLTDQSHGNALGIGMVDLTTRRMMDKIDLKATYTNALTTGIWTSARLPMALEDDRAAIEAALSRSPDPERVRMARIKSTLMLETFWVTGTLVPELTRKKTIEIGEDPLHFEFGADGRMLPFSGG